VFVWSGRSRGVRCADRLLWSVNQCHGFAFVWTLALLRFQLSGIPCDAERFRKSPSRINGPETVARRLKRKMQDKVVVGYSGARASAVRHDPRVHAWVRFGPSRRCWATMLMVMPAVCVLTGMAAQPDHSTSAVAGDDGRRGVVVPCRATARRRSRWPQLTINFSRFCSSESPT
jgi:hypothetical protein